MREYNTNVSKDKRIKFVCYDQQYIVPGEKTVLDYLEKVAPHRSERAKELFKNDVNSIQSQQFQGNDDRKKEAQSKMAELHAKYLELLGLFTLNEKNFISKSSSTEFQKVLMQVRVMAQYLDAFGDDKSPGRDFYMAETIERLLENEPPQTKAVIWAHNAHIQKIKPGSTQDQDMGWQLSRTFGDRFYSIGFSFNRGSFRSMSQEEPFGLKAFEVDSAPPNTIDWQFANTGFKNFFIDLRDSKKEINVREWFAQKHRMRSIGSGYRPSIANYYFSETSLGESFDAVVFFDRTTSARPL
jgi:erythromycin esterase